MPIREIIKAARKAARKLNYERAKELLFQVVSINPLEYQALADIRKNYVDNNKFNDGIKYFKQLLEKDPSNSHAQKHLGIIYAQMGNSPKAIAYLSQVIKDHSDDVILFGELGLAYNKQGNTKGVNRCFKKILHYYSSKEIKDTAEKVDRVETELIKASKLTAAAAMASGFAHQINNPLFNIQLSTEVLLTKIQSEKYINDKEFFTSNTDEIFQNIQRISELINHLNRLVKYKSEKQESFNLIDVIHSAYELFSAQLAQRKIKWEEEFQAEHFMLYGNFTKLEQVFINLISNAQDALKGIANPHIRIQISINNDWIRIDFSDNGIGIPKDIQKNIFQSIFTTKEQGTGIGLWLCSTIVEQMGGNIKFKSHPKVGTNFTIKLRPV